MPTLTPVKPLVFLRCGGTFEKTYNVTQGALNFDDANLERWVEQCRIAPKARIETVMLMDSLEMHDEHRQQLADTIAHTKEERIIVIHGTDTMVESALFMAPFQQSNQVIVFTGAMIPAASHGSDALFNLGLATAAVQLLPAGIYIAMSGQIFDARCVRKNLTAGQFEESSELLANTKASEDLAKKIV
jgi:L-asparaginase